MQDATSFARRDSVLRQALSEIWVTIGDGRQSGKVDFELHDCLMILNHVAQA
jgi:hypothetical protein